MLDLQNIIGIVKRDKFLFLHSSLPFIRTLDKPHHGPHKCNLILCNKVGAQQKDTETLNSNKSIVFTIETKPII